MVQPSAAVLDTLASLGHLLDHHPSHPYEASRQGGTSWDRQEVHLLTLGSGRPRTADGQPLMVSLPSPVRAYQVPASPWG